MVAARAVVTQPLSLTLVDVALIASLRNEPGLAHDKLTVVNTAQKLLGDPDLDKMQLLTALQRLVDLGIVQVFGGQLVPTPRGTAALATFRQRVENISAHLSG